MKLSSKLAAVIGVCLMAVFSVLIGVTSLLAGTAITESVSSELTAISKANGSQIQNIFDTAGMAAVNIQNYLNKAYKIANSSPERMRLPTDPAVAELTQSEIYHKTLTPLNYNTEQYILESARNLVSANEDIVGIGVMFGMFKFQGDMENYAFYVDKGSAEGVIEPFGDYKDYSQEGYYKDAAGAKKPVVTDIHEYKGNRMVSYATPILYNNQVQSVVRADINVSNFSKVDYRNERYPSLRSVIYNDSLQVIYDSGGPEGGKAPDGLALDENGTGLLNERIKEGGAFRIQTADGEGREVIRFFTPIEAGSETWWSLTALNRSDMDQAVSRTILWLSLLSVLALALLLAVTVFVLKIMLKPLKQVVAAAQSISRGDLEVNLPSGKKDEIGVLSGTFLEMSGNLKTMVRDVDHILGNMAEGNFDVAALSEESYQGEFKGFLRSMNVLNEKLSSALNQINQSADQVSMGSAQLSSGAQALSQGACVQASSVEELAASINGISSKIKANAENARQASLMADDTGRKMMDSNTQMERMMEAMEEISQNTRAIEKIVKTIEDIAFQTNVLSLNAAVEAARAGAAGKGFAVVARQVRKLAGESAEASKNTEALIENSIRVVKNGTKIADETARALTEAVERVERINRKIHGISIDSEGQTSSIHQITQGIDAISRVVQTNSATAEESAAASEELSGQALVMKGLVGQFRLRNPGVMEPK